MDNTGINLFSYRNNSAQKPQKVKVNIGQDWSQVKSGDKDVDSILAKADLNGDGKVQADELNNWTKLMQYADSQFEDTANNGVLDKKELNFLQKMFKKGKIDMNNLPDTPVRTQSNGKPWSEGLDRNIRTVEMAGVGYDMIDGFKTVVAEMQEIGKAEGFTVKLQSGKEPWSEDSKINRADGKTYVQYYNEEQLHQNESAVDAFMADGRNSLAKSQGKVAKSGASFKTSVNNNNRHIGTSYLEGGNVLQTLNSKGEAGAVVGDMSVAYTMSVMNLDNTPENVEKAKQAIANDLGIEKENLTVIPQNDFHIDMQYRPLNNGEMAVPDYSEGIKVLENILKNENLSKSDRKMYEQMLEKLKEKQADTKETENRNKAEQTLISSGYKLVRIPDFGDSNINYMNGVGGTSNNDGKKFFITNKSKFPELDKAVEQYYKDAGVDRVYFVSTQGALDKRGGIDCLTNASM